MEFISEIIKTKIDTSPEFDLEVVRKNGKNIIVLSVFSGKNTPYFYVESGSRIAYKRIGNQSVVANKIDIVNLVFRVQKVSFDALPANKTRQEVSFKELAAEYKANTDKQFVEEDLKSFGLIDKEGNLTFAGSLFADGHQVYQLFFALGGMGLIRRVCWLMR